MPLHQSHISEEIHNQELARGQNFTGSPESATESTEHSSEESLDVSGKVYGTPKILNNWGAIKNTLATIINFNQ